MKNLIEVNNIRLYAFHGCLEEEARIGSNYRVDVRVKTDFLDAAADDDLRKTVNYVDINRIVTEEMAIRSKLLEHVGYRIYKRLQNEIGNLESIYIRVAKICPPINGDVENVAIIIEDGIW